MATTLVNMKMSAEERAEQAPTAATDMPEYPYGLRLDLDDDALAKLGLTTLPAAGSVLLLIAHVEVVNRGTSQEKGGDEEAHVSLQITDMALSAPDTTPPEEKLYT